MDWCIHRSTLRKTSHIKVSARNFRQVPSSVHKRSDIPFIFCLLNDVFHVEREAVTNEMREQAKAVNFGIIYGISDYGLSQNLGITRKEAKSFIDRYLETYPGVKKYMEDIVQEAKYKGYVTTLMNRRRYLPEITSRNFNMRSFAERTAKIGRAHV